MPYAIYMYYILNAIYVYCSYIPAYLPKNPASWISDTRAEQIAMPRISQRRPASCPPSSVSDATPPPTRE